MTQFAKDVAKQLDRRQRRRRLVVLVGASVAIVLAVLYLRCGRGWGLGSGTGTGSGSGAAARSAVDAGPVRCSIRVAATGITVDGKPGTRTEAVAACKRTTGADVTVTGDAREGDWTDLRTALEAAHVPIYARLGTVSP